MKYEIKITPRIFHFKQPAGTSRGVYTTRQSWMIELTSPEMPGRKGIGECAPLPDLSCDYKPDYEETLHTGCATSLSAKEVSTIKRCVTIRRCCSEWKRH